MQRNKPLRLAAGPLRLAAGPLPLAAVIGLALTVTTVACEQDEFDTPETALEADDPSTVVTDPADDEATGEPSLEIDTTPEPESESGPGELRHSLPPLLARVERGSSAVEWRAPADSGDQVLLMITGTDADDPIIDMDTAEGLTPVEAWVAVADAPTAVPERLLERASVADLELLSDELRIDELRAEVHTRVAAALDIQAPLPEPHAFGACTTSQVNAARSVFGNGYTGSSTCGQHLGFRYTNRTYWYCNAGDCDYPLAQNEFSCIPAVNNNSAVTGRLRALTMRSNTHGDPNFSTGGSHRTRAFAYACHNNGNVSVHLDWGPHDWDTQIASGYYTGVVVLGSGHLPGRATAIDIVSYNTWDNGIGESGANYKSSNFWVSGNTANGDRGIFCSDAQKSLTMGAGPTGNQHSWCIGSCSVGNCWD